MASSWELFSYLPGKADQGYVYGLVVDDLDNDERAVIHMDAKEFEDLRNAIEAMYRNPTKQAWKKL